MTIHKDESTDVDPVQVNLTVKNPSGTKNTNTNTHTHIDMECQRLGSGIQ